MSVSGAWHKYRCTALWQVNSEFQAFKHIESLGRGELMRASRPLEVTVAVYPTLVLTNALPYDMDIVVWQVCSSPMFASQGGTNNMDMVVSQVLLSPCLCYKLCCLCISRSTPVTHKMCTTAAKCMLLAAGLSYTCLLRQQLPVALAAATRRLCAATILAHLMCHAVSRTMPTASHYCHGGDKTLVTEVRQNEHDHRLQQALIDDGAGETLPKAA